MSDSDCLRRDSPAGAAIAILRLIVPDEVFAYLYKVCACSKDICSGSEPHIMDPQRKDF